MSTQHRNWKQPTKNTAIALGLGLVVLFSMPSTGFASDRDHHGRQRQQGHHYRGQHGSDRDHHQYPGHHQYRRHDRYRETHRRQGHHDRHSFSLPRILRHEHYSSYSSYYHGQSYYAPHGHHHRIYHFPAWTGSYYRSTPYAYCNGEIFYSPQRHHRGFSFHFGF